MFKIVCITALLATCYGAPQLNLGSIFGNGGSSGGGSGGSQQTQPPSQGQSNCPLNCPPGWVRFALSEHCYKLPEQPVYLDTFWEWDRRCKAFEPTSYVAVSSSIQEQLVGSAVAVQYAPTWFADLTNAFIWLGGYTDQTGWKFLDGTDQSGSVLFLGAGIANLFSKPNDTCLGADAYTLGLWQTYSCENKRGTAFCEMPMRPVCGPTGSILPISPISTDPMSLFNLFPGMPKIPYISQLLGSTGLENSLTDVASAIKCYVTGQSCPGSGLAPTPLPKGCFYDCPFGWQAWDRSPSGHCYMLPRSIEHVTLEKAQATCQSYHSASYVMVLNSLLELMMTSSTLKLWQWRDAFLWLGQYVKNNQWNYYDKSEEAGNLLMSLANPEARLPGTFKDNTCMSISLVDGGNWKQVPCDQPNGLFFCEMPKQVYCGSKGQGTNTSFTDIQVTLERVKQLFPNIPPGLPFLEEVLNGVGQSQTLDVNDLTKSIQSAVMNLGPGIASVICVRKDGDWTDLTIKGNIATINGQWTSVSCKNTKYAFQASSTAVLSAWSRCFNKGYELAMPVWRPLSSQLINSLLKPFTGWYPFRVGDKLAEFYAEKGLLSFINLGSSHEKIPASTVSSC